MVPLHKAIKWLSRIIQNENITSLQSKLHIPQQTLISANSNHKKLEQHKTNLKVTHNITTNNSTLNTQFKKVATFSTHFNSIQFKTSNKISTPLKNSSNQSKNP